MPRWTPADIPWQDFTPQALDPAILRIVKAAALTEFNAEHYARYLKNVFSGDAAFAVAADAWRAEEEQHGRMLGRYAEMADSSFSFRGAFGAFRDGYRIPVDVDQSVRGSRTGEMLARCIVETGTSSFYSAIAEATTEPVLKALARRIASDEFRHYGMFRRIMDRYQPCERLSLAHRIGVAVGRLRELDDDELPFAYHCANTPERTYDRAVSAADYASFAYRLYRPDHAERATAMILKATGLPATGVVRRLATRFAWWRLQAAVAAAEAA